MEAFWLNSCSFTDDELNFQICQYIVTKDEQTTTAIASIFHVVFL